MKISKCKHCQEEFDILQYPKGCMANHSRWCEKNPKRDYYHINQHNALEAMRVAREKSGRKNQYTVSKLEGRDIPVSPNKGNPGAFRGKSHTEETKKILSEKARASKHRRLRRGMVDYNGVMMDSSWEVRMAKVLDNQDIKWVRPEPIPYTDKSGKIRNYFPDFYLEEYDLFLDPKNPAAYAAQKEKIDILTNTYSNIIILRSLNEIDNFTPVLALSSKQ